MINVYMGIKRIFLSFKRSSYPYYYCQLCSDDEEWRQFLFQESRNIPHLLVSWTTFTSSKISFASPKKSLCCFLKLHFKFDGLIHVSFVILWNSVWSCFLAHPQDTILIRICSSADTISRLAHSLIFIHFVLFSKRNFTLLTNQVLWYIEFNAIIFVFRLFTFWFDIWIASTSVFNRNCFNSLLFFSMFYPSFTSIF